MSLDINVAFICSQSRHQMVPLTVSASTVAGELDVHLLQSLSIKHERLPDFYVLCQGRHLASTDLVEDGKVYHIIPRVLGGKGGFGSMLRAIGAQIEKTTSREACRDLSGRRMRDINNEKKLKEWLAKEADREKDREERRADRLARQLNPPQHKFEDQQYQDQKAKVQEDLQDALQTGLKRAHTKTQGSSKGEPSQAKVARTNGSRKEWLGVEMDSDDSDLEADPGCPDMTAEPSAKVSASTSDAEGSSGSPVCTGAGSPSPPPPGRTSDSLVCEEVKSEQEPEETQDNDASEDRSVPELKPDPFLKPKSSLLSSLPAPKSKPPDIKEECPDIKPDLTEVPTGPVDLTDFPSESSLCSLGLERLKSELMARGLKCGGTLEERANRLWVIRGLDPDDFPPALVAKSKGKGKKSKPT